jgi:prepilin-type N-terminal cleavage/methylation domain-containing protein
MKTKKKTYGEKGFTLWEMMVVLALVGMLVAAAFESIYSGVKMFGATGTTTDMQDQARRALETMVTDLRQAGANQNYPIVSDVNGNIAPASYTINNDKSVYKNFTAPAKHVTKGEAAKTSVGLLCRMPATDPANFDKPITATGDIYWSINTEIGYVLTGRPDGTNVLERRVYTTNGGVTKVTTKRLARNVERLDVLVSAPPRDITITIYMWNRTDDGIEQSTDLSTTVVMRNNQE